MPPPGPYAQEPFNGYSEDSRLCCDCTVSPETEWLIVSGVAPMLFQSQINMVRKQPPALI